MAEIVVLAGRFRTLAELQAYCDAQYKSLEKSSMRIKLLEEEVEHLKRMLASTVPLPESSDSIIVSDDLAIAEMQITRLKAIAMVRELSLEEVKKLEILTNIRYLAIEKNAELKPPEKDVESLSNDELIRIASDPEAV